MTDLGTYLERADKFRTLHVFYKRAASSSQDRSNAPPPVGSGTEQHYENGDLATNDIMLGRILLTVDAVTLLFGAWAADYNTDTHIFNPRWPPHAK